ncbi:uncharacterized protein LOC131207403 [Anopheles bellator]|uniref:uncharacterized protein LOC131207403 n=1 Tax=Anopheles bellator TaxID=139047 RepID=UPI002649E392|nr:uncharacterized protein LOC131207403 [Anopheles bellator]
MVRREVLFLPVVAFAIGAMCGPVDDEQRKPTIISTAQLSVDPETAMKLLPETELPTRDQDEELPTDSSTPVDVASESNQVGTSTTEPSANNGSTGTTEIDESYTEEGRTTLMAEVLTTLKPKAPENSTVADLNATTTTIIPFERSTSEGSFSTTHSSVTQPAEVTVAVTHNPEAPVTTTVAGVTSTPEPPASSTSQTVTTVRVDTTSAEAGTTATTLGTSSSTGIGSETTHNPEAPVTTTVAGVTTTPEPPASSTSQAVTTVRVDTTSAEAGTTATTPGTSSSTGIGSETTVTTIKPETTTSGVGLLTSGGVVLLASLLVSWL